MFKITVLRTRKECILTQLIGINHPSRQLAKLIGCSVVGYQCLAQILPSSIEQRGPLHANERFASIYASNYLPRLASPPTILR